MLSTYSMVFSFVRVTGRKSERCGRNGQAGAYGPFGPTPEGLEKLTAFLIFEKKYDRRGQTDRKYRITYEIKI